MAISRWFSVFSIHVRCSVFDSLGFCQIFCITGTLFADLCQIRAVCFNMNSPFEVAKHQWKTHHELELRHWINPTVGEAFRRYIDALMLRS